MYPLAGAYQYFSYSLSCSVNMKLNSQIFFLKEYEINIENMFTYVVHKPRHTVNPSSEMIGALYISGKNIFWSTHVCKNRERIFFEILHCPFELPANQHWPTSTGHSAWPNGRCWLAGGSKGQGRKSIFVNMSCETKIFF